MPEQIRFLTYSKNHVSRSIISDNEFVSVACWIMARELVLRKGRKKISVPQ